MDDSRRRLTDARLRVPDRPMRFAGATGTRSLGLGRHASSTLLLVHPDGCADCRSFLLALATRVREFSDWGGQVIVCVPSEDAGGIPRLLPSEVSVVLDPGGALEKALSATAPAALVADQWGEVHYLEMGGADHRLPPPAELTSWARYLAIRCPECEGEAL